MVAQKAEAKKERGEGAMVVTYADTAGKSDYKRVPDKVASVVVMQRNGNKSKVYSITELPQNIKDSLAAMALATRAKTYIANHGNKEGTNVIELVDGVFAEMKNGKIYAKSADGDKPGRKFDATMYADAMRLATIAMNKKGRTSTKTGKVIQPITDKQYEDFKVKLTSMAPKERSEEIRRLKKDSFYAKALLEVQAKSFELDTDASDLF